MSGGLPGFFFSPCKSDCDCDAGSSVVQSLTPWAWAPCALTPWACAPWARGEWVHTWSGGQLSSREHPLPFDSKAVWLLPLLSLPSMHLIPLASVHTLVPLFPLVPLVPVVLMSSLELFENCGDGQLPSRQLPSRARPFGLSVPSVPSVPSMPSVRAPSVPSVRAASVRAASVQDVRCIF